MLFFLIILFIVGYIILPRIRIKIEQEKCDKIYANKILKLPDKEKNNVGFTCTGLYWDKEEEYFFIGNAGKYKPNDKTFQASIEIVEKDFSIIKGDICRNLYIYLDSIGIYSFYPHSTGISSI